MWLKWLVPSSIIACWEDYWSHKHTDRGMCFRQQKVQSAAVESKRERRHMIATEHKQDRDRLQVKAPKEEETSARECFRHQHAFLSWLFISTVQQSTQYQSILVLHCLLTSAVNGCHQNESSNGLWKHHNYPQVIHMTPVHQLTSCEAKSC